MPPSEEAHEPRRSREEYLGLVNELITEGQGIQRDIQTRVVHTDITGFDEQLGFSTSREERVLDRSRFLAWQSSWASLMGELVPQTHPKRQRINELCNDSAEPSTLEEMLSLLAAKKRDIERNLLGIPLASSRKGTEQKPQDSATADLKNADQLTKEKKRPAALRSIAQWLWSFIKTAYALTVEKFAKGMIDSLTKRP